MLLGFSMIAAFFGEQGQVVAGQVPEDAIIDAVSHSATHWYVAV